jgi:hypothetical protein
MLSYLTSQTPSFWRKLAFVCITSEPPATACSSLVDMPCKVHRVFRGVFRASLWSYPQGRPRWWRREEIWAHSGKAILLPYVGNMLGKYSRFVFLHVALNLSWFGVQVETTSVLGSRMAQKQTREHGFWRKNHHFASSCDYWHSIPSVSKEMVSGTWVELRNHISSLAGLD